MDIKHILFSFFPGIVAGIIIIVLIFICVRLCLRRNKRGRRRNNISGGVANDGNDVYLNLLKDDKHNYKAENILKIDNNKRKTPPSPQPPPVPDRPVSYTPSVNRDSMNTLNNFDQLRTCNYGSAADDLENPPNIPYNNLEFLQTFAPVRNVASIQPTIPPPPQSDTDSLRKDSGNWESACQNILQNYQPGMFRFCCLCKSSRNYNFYINNNILSLVNLRCINFFFIYFCSFTHTHDLLSLSILKLKLNLFHKADIVLQVKLFT